MEAVLLLIINILHLATSLVSAWKETAVLGISVFACSDFSWLLLGVCNCPVRTRKALGEPPNSPAVSETLYSNAVMDIHVLEIFIMLDDPLIKFFFLN